MAAALGIPSYGVRAIAQSKNDKNECNQTFSELFIINLISSLVATALYLIAVFLLKDSNSNLALSLVFSGIIIFNIINIEWVYQGFEEYEYITIRSLLIKVISLLLLLVFVRRKSDVVAYAFIICFGIDIVVYKVMNVLMPQSAQMYLLPISIFCVSVCSYIGAIIVTKIADVLIQIAGFFAKSQKRMR